MSKAVMQLDVKTGVLPEFLCPGLLAGLATDRTRVEHYLEDLLKPAGSSRSNPVPLAMEYAVVGKAQRIRPILALRVARLLGAETDAALRAAVAVELIHSASLIIDDLPCMDNELMRRGKPATHIAFGEPTAILAAFSMVALAARIVMESAESGADCLRLRRYQLALLRTLDCSSLVGGQSMDLNLAGAERDAMRAAVNEMKTVPLFELAVEAGCVSYPKAAPAGLSGFGRDFGVAFQLTDDLLDGELNDRKILDNSYEQCRLRLQPFGASAEPLLQLVEYLEQRSRA
jgi:geranylgeranyl pyrophosphate synthase